MARELSSSSFLVGRDTRLSGPLLQAALSAGLAAEGAEVIDVGVLPTPAVAALSADRHLPAAVVSASHNPYPDNGVKLFAAGGLKLAREVEARIEAALAGSNFTAPSPAKARTGRHLGLLRSDPAARQWYCEGLVGALQGRRLEGIRVVLDCANGAGAATAPEVFGAAGAEIVAVIGAEPDGTNINAGCGATAPGALAEEVLARGADVGVALDGDGDRMIAVDDSGAIVDGDRLLALFALDMHARGILAGDTVVVTVMSNLGLHQALRRAGLVVKETSVGDRHVLEALEEGGFSLGGEQSGHIIFRDLGTTGDGTLCGLLLLDLLVRSGRPLAKLAAEAMVSLPQVLRTVHVADPAHLEDAGAVWEEVRSISKALGSGGRVLLRPSGTERAVRVMVEAQSESAAAEAAERLAQVVESALGPRGDHAHPGTPEQHAGAEQREPAPPLSQDR